MNHKMSNKMNDRLDQKKSCKMNDRMNQALYLKKGLVGRITAGIMALFISCMTFDTAMADTGDNSGNAGMEAEEYGDYESQDGGQIMSPVSTEVVLTDTIEYGQIKEWIRQYNPVIKSANESYYIMAEEAMKVAERMREEANELYEEAKDLEDVGTPEAKEAARVLKKNVRELRKYAKKQQDASEDMDESHSSSRRQLNHTEDTMTYNVQMLVNTYWQLQSQRVVVEKSVEAAQAALNAAQNMASQGMVVESGLLASANGLGSAKASLTAIDSSIEQISRNIYTLTGQGYASGVRIGRMPPADLGHLSEINLEKDCEAAIGNNYELIVQRHTDLEKKTNKTVNGRLREIEDAEARMKITVTGLYQDMMEKKASYEGSRAAYESAQIIWNGAQIQNQQGMLSRIEFLQKEAEFLSARSTYEVAELELFQAMETYDWAVKGLVVSEEQQ
ncbi:TolC family protein [Lachnospiraceae bacterium 62-35]